MTAYSLTKTDPRRILPAVEVRMKKFRPLQEPISLQDLFNSARSRAEKRIGLWMHAESFGEHERRVRVSRADSREQL